MLHLNRDYLFHSVFLKELFLLLLIAPGCITAQDILGQHPSELPSDLVLQEDIPQKYRLIVDYQTRDIYGNFLEKMQLTAEYTRALPEGKVRWNNVRKTSAVPPQEPFPEGELQEYMEGFTYDPSGDLFSESFFKGFPQGVIETRVLIWDMLSIEVWGWYYYDHLRLNEAYRPLPEGESFDLAGDGSFHNKDQQLTWTGVSEMNGETCALIQYESLFNPLDMNAGAFSVKGRTSYWGNIWVSLQDKQIEYATLYEDGILEMVLPDSQEKTLVNVFRDISFSKVVEGSAETE